MIELPADDSPVLEVLISLDPASVEVWRRVLVPADMRLDRFHDVIQTAMGWHDCHPHLFSTGEAEYGPADPERDHRDERSVTVGEFLVEPGSHLRYSYGPAGDWEHIVSFEGRSSPDPAELYPTCLAGAGACPPDDGDAAWRRADPDRVPADGEPGNGEILARRVRRDAAESGGTGFDLEQARDALAFLSGVP